MKQESPSHPKWEGKVTSTLAKANADQVWTFFTDFFGTHKYSPSASTSYGVHGNNGEVGCIRYIEFVLGGGGDGPKNWVKEKLVAIDPVERSFSYEIVETNGPFNSYVAIYKILPGSGDDGNGGCSIEWSYSLEPIEGLKLEDLQKSFEGMLQLTAEKMDDSI